jgi:ubiquinone/menaquinone biosynthesis C-methylase UbiE
MSDNLSIKIVQSPWLEAILTDPVSKAPLIKKDNSYCSQDGNVFNVYYIKETVPDFRVHINQQEEEWHKGQDAYESWMNKYLDNAEKNSQYYPDEKKRDEPMYKRLALEGRVLDVGGNLGAIRQYMAQEQEYCSVDPFINVYKLAAGRKKFFASYPMHLPLNFVAGFAEFLPFKSCSFNTVNMRSCIDHFFSPEDSLLEAHRVLDSNGKLIIGMTVKVKSVKNFLKETARCILNVFTDRYRDDHIWHPSKDEIVELCCKCGFKAEDEIWQNENVWYGSFRKI